MKKEHKIFLSTCGSILAVVAIAIVLSYSAGGSFATESESDYECSKNGFSIAAYSNTMADGIDGYVCCPPGYSYSAGLGEENATGATAMCYYRIYSQEAADSCTYNGTGYYGVSQSPYNGMCVYTPDHAVKKSACYLCGGSSQGGGTYEWGTGDGGSCVPQSSYTNKNDCVANNNQTGCYYCGGSSQGGGTYSWGKFATTSQGGNCVFQSSYTDKSSCEAKNNNNSSNENGNNNNNNENGNNNNNNNNNSTQTVTKYSVVYDANGGILAILNDEKVQGVDLTLTTVKPLREGYTFVGWNTKSDGTGTSYNSGGIYSTDEDVTLYAVWNESERNTVTYDANGGTGAPDSQFKSVDSIITTSITLSDKKPTRTGYTFVEWNTKSDGSGESYNPGDTYSDDESITLYAIWKKNADNSTVTPTDKTDKTDEEITKNSKTGNTMMIVAWITAFAALCFTALYFKRKSEF